jgi:predicted DNA-binding transcriptional regulator AlpA
MPDDLKLLSQRDLAAMLGVSVSTIRRWRDRGIVPNPIYKTSRSVFWTQQQIAEWQKINDASSVNKHQ